MPKGEKVTAKEPIKKHKKHKKSKKLGLQSYPKKLNDLKKKNSKKNSRINLMLKPIPNSDRVIGSFKGTIDEWMRIGMCNA